MFIAVQVVKLEVRDYILYIVIASLLGLIPLLFILFQWVTHPFPSFFSVVLSIIMVVASIVIVVFSMGPASFVCSVGPQPVARDGWAVCPPRVGDRSGERQRIFRDFRNFPASFPSVSRIPLRQNRIGP